MISITRLLAVLGTTGLLASKAAANAAADADALPWANANPQAQAAAQAYADAYAEAQAIGHPDPEAFALAASEDDCASIACHAACGMLIIYGTDCAADGGYTGPYDTDCLCSADSNFIKQYPACMECGWTLWKYYSGYVTDALAACGTLSTEPTGTLRCSTTLTDIYTPDTDLQACEYTGGCTTTSSTVTSASSSSSSISSTEESNTAVASSTTSQSSSTTTTPPTSTTESTEYTYSATHITETDNLSFEHTYSPDGELTDCTTTTRHFAVATNNPIDIEFGAWLEKKQYNTSSTAMDTVSYFYFNFTEDQTEVTDIKFLTGTTEKTSQIVPESEVHINLKQGVWGFFNAHSSNPSANNGVLLVTHKGTKYLYSYSCLTTRLTLTKMLLPEGTYDYCYTVSYWGIFYEPFCDHATEPNDTLFEFRPAAAGEDSSSDVISSSSDSISSSSGPLSSESSESSSGPVSSSSEAESSAPETESSSAAQSSSQAEESSSAAQSSSQAEDSSSAAQSSSQAEESSSAAQSSSQAEESSSAAQSSQAEESSSAAAEESSSGAAESSAIESSSGSESSSSIVEASSSEEVPSSSAAESSPIPSRSSEPILSGDVASNGLPSFSLSVPGSLGPWTELAFNASNEGPFTLSSAELLVNGEAVDTASVIFTASTVSVVFEVAVDLEDVVTIIYGGEFTESGSVTSRGFLSITTPDEGLVKRDTQTWEFESTITADAISSSDDLSSTSDASSGDSSTASDASSGAESATSVESSTATETLSSSDSSSVELSSSEDISTQSEYSSDSSVSSISSAADVTSSDGSNIITTSTATETDIGTTVVTITSCDEDKCSETAVTTGVTVITSTKEGVETEYTTYCPLSTTEVENIGTTVVTITSCQEDKCSKTAVTTGVTVITSTKEGVVTEYTTYCPLPTTEVVKTKTGSTVSKEKTGTTTTGNAPAKSTESKAVSSKDKSAGTATEGLSTVTEVVTSTVNGKPTTYETVKTQADTTGEAPAASATTGTSVASVSTFEGVGQKLVVGSTFVAFIFSLLLI
jgi:hypothetical protein